MSGRYDDILRRERPQIPGHPAMPRAARAAQFAPFAALTGYGAVVARSTGRPSRARTWPRTRRPPCRKRCAALPRARTSTRALPRPTSCPTRERAGAPMSRPWARCAASTNAGGPGARGRRAHPPGRPLRPCAALERDGNQAGPKNRRRSPGGCAAFAATYFAPGRAKERGRLCHGRGRAAPHRRERAGPGARGRRAHPLWTTSPTSRCFRAGRKPGGPQKQAAQPGRLRRFCRDLLRARRAKERGRLCHGRGRAAPHRRERAGPGARGRRAHPSGRPLRPRAALERDGNQAVPQKTGGAAREAAPLLPRTISCPTRERAGGAYVTAVGALRRIDESARALVLEGGARIPLDDPSDLALL